MSETTELSRCPDCGKPAYACDCPTYCGDDDMPDAINPSHYKGKRWECIEIIEAHGLDHFRATALAYILRARRKNGEEDLRKAVWYLKRLAGSIANIANACSFAVTDPARAVEMTGESVADDFEITGLLRIAVASITLNADEFSTPSTLIEDLTDAIAAIECHLEDLAQDAAAKAAQP